MDKNKKDITIKYYKWTHSGCLEIWAVRSDGMEKCLYYHNPGKLKTSWNDDVPAIYSEWAFAKDNGDRPFLEDYNDEEYLEEITEKEAFIYAL